jgi:hypothetical protein
MIHDLCIPLTMKIMGLGRPLYKAERIAAVLVIWVVLLCVLMGCPIRLPDVSEEGPDNVPGSRDILSHVTGLVSIRGIFPGIAGTATGLTHSLVNTQ